MKGFLALLILAALLTACANKPKPWVYDGMAYGGICEANCDNSAVHDISREAAK